MKRPLLVIHIPSFPHFPNCCDSIFSLFFLGNGRRQLYSFSPFVFFLRFLPYDSNDNDERTRTCWLAFEYSYAQTLKLIPFLGFEERLPDRSPPPPIPKTQDRHPPWTIHKGQATPHKTPRKESLRRFPLILRSNFGNTK